MQYILWSYVNAQCIAISKNLQFLFWLPIKYLLKTHWYWYFDCIFLQFTVFIYKSDTNSIQKEILSWFSLSAQINHCNISSSILVRQNRNLKSMNNIAFHQNQHYFFLNEIQDLTFSEFFFLIQELECCTIVITFLVNLLDSVRAN